MKQFALPAELFSLKRIINRLSVKASQAQRAKITTGIMLPQANEIIPQGLAQQAQNG